MSKTVFLSRELGEGHPLRSMLASAGFEVIARPMISSEPVPFGPLALRSGWIFFSSKQGVMHFFSQSPQTGKCSFAAIGDGTARILRKFGEVAFTGHDPDTREVAREFKKIAGRKKVYFPISEQSVRTVQQALPASQVEDIVCYRTVETPSPVGHPDILVFSSPSNVEAFLQCNTLLPSQRLVAFGKTTGEALHRLGHPDVIISRGTSDQALLEAINRASLG